MTELVLSTQLAQAVDCVDAETGASLRAAFDSMFAQADDWVRRAASIKITSEDQTREMKFARESRLALREIRVNAEKTRKKLKADSLLRSRAIDGIYNVIAALIEPVEEHLLEQEMFAERQADKRREQLREARRATLVAFGANPSTFADLGLMTDEAWSQIIADTRAAHEAREAKKKAEREAAEVAATAAREADEKRRSDAADRERAAAEERAKLEQDRTEALRVAAEERAARERSEAEARAARERQEAETLRANEETTRLRREVEAANARTEAERGARERAEAQARVATPVHAEHAPETHPMAGGGMTITWKNHLQLLRAWVLYNKAHNASFPALGVAIDTALARLKAAEAVVTAANAAAACTCGEPECKALEDFRGARVAYETLVREQGP